MIDIYFVFAMMLDDVGFRDHEYLYWRCNTEFVNKTLPEKNIEHCVKIATNFQKKFFLGQEDFDKYIQYKEYFDKKY